MIKHIIAVTRSCVACGESERAANGQFIYHELGRVPSDTRCARCGMHMLMADEAEARTVRIEPAIDWTTERPRIGRPSNAVRAARRAEAERLGLTHTGAVHSRPIPIAS